MKVLNSIEQTTGNILRACKRKTLTDREKWLKINEALRDARCSGYSDGIEHMRQKVRDFING